MFRGSFEATRMSCDIVLKAVAHIFMLDVIHFKFECFVFIV